MTLAAFHDYSLTADLLSIFTFPAMNVSLGEVLDRLRIYYSTTAANATIGSLRTEVYAHNQPPTTSTGFRDGLKLVDTTIGGIPFLVSVGLYLASRDIEIPLDFYPERQNTYVTVGLTAVAVAAGAAVFMDTFRAAKK